MKLEKKLALKEVIIVPNSNTDIQNKTKYNLGKTSVDYLKRILKDGDVLGLSWGSTIGSIVHYLEESRSVSANIVPLVGGPINVKK